MSIEINGWRFERLPNGNVRMERRESDQMIYAMTFAADAWDAIVASLAREEKP